MISIIAPVFNTAPYLAQCIESVRMQTEEDWELILVDDGSSDGSQDIIREYVASDTRIRFLESNAGCVSIARNTGMRAARGEWMFFLDSDDYLAPDCLAKLLIGAKDYPEADVIQASFKVENMSTGKISTSFRAEKRRPFANKIVTGYQFIKNHDWLAGVAWNTLYRSSFLRKHNIEYPSEIAYQEDLIFILECVRNHGKFVYLDVDTYIYRWGRRDSLTSGAEGSAEKRMRRKLRLQRDLIRAAGYYQSILHEFPADCRKLLRRYISRNVIGVIRDLHTSPAPHNKEIYNQILSDFRKLPITLSYKGFPMAIVYNLSPGLAFMLSKLI